MSDLSYKALHLGCVKKIINGAELMLHAQVSEFLPQKTDLDSFPIFLMLVALT